MAITFHACLSLSHLTVMQVLRDIGAERNLNRTPAMTRRPAFYIFDGLHHPPPANATRPYIIRKDCIFKPSPIVLTAATAAAEYHQD